MKIQGYQMTLRTIALICLLVFSLDSSAYSILTRTKDIQAPVFRKITGLTILTDNSKLKSVSADFFGKSGLITNEKWTKKFQLQDFSSCRSFPCEISIFNFPVVLEKVTCEVKLTLEFLDSVSKQEQVSWGACQNSPSRPPERFLSDLSFAEDISNVNDFSIQNEGASIQGKMIRVFSYLEDENKNVIWAKDILAPITILDGESSRVILQEKLENWQEHLGCNGFVSIDSEYGMHEKKKKNNEIKISQGACEKTPDASSGDKFDFEPFIEVDGNQVTFAIFNRGRLPVTNPYEIIQYEIIYQNSSGRTIHQRKLSISEPLHGFDQSKIVFKETVNDDVCRISVTVNRDLSLKESNYNNNQKQISYCNTVKGSL